MFIPLLMKIVPCHKCASLQNLQIGLLIYSIRITKIDYSGLEGIGLLLMIAEGLEDARCCKN